MFRYTISLLAVAAFPSVALAGPDIPSWCCPSTCQVANGSITITPSIGQSGEAAIVLGEKRIPFSKNYFRGDAPDGQTRLCIGFDAFGNPEVKCLFSPLPLT